MTKAEKKVLEKLLDEVETARQWFDDTTYPRASRAAFEEALAEVKAVFHMHSEEALTP